MSDGWKRMNSKFRKREREREGWRERVCLDQMHSKSVYSAQFGIKHNRLLSACYCLWCPIKMEFIAALRARPNYTFSSLLRLPFALLPFLLQLWWCGSFLFYFSPQTSCSTCQTSHPNSSLQSSRYIWSAHLPVSQHHRLSSVTLSGANNKPTVHECGGSYRSVNTVLLYTSLASF